ncbi:MopE-related protein [Thermodesulfobacteriota bacterium]
MQVTAKTLFSKVLLTIFAITLFMVSGCTQKSDEKDIDFDRDGYTMAQGDCDDYDVSIHPIAVDICGDGIDQDCDGSDRICDDSDSDSDGYTMSAGDCNDEDASIHPGATEIACDGIDQDCDGKDDTDCVYYKDQDSDGYGNNANYLRTDVVLENYVLNNSDCNDFDATLNPGLAEVCADGKDNNCNGQVDEGCTEIGYFKDADGDSWVNLSDFQVAGTAPTGYILDTHYGVGDCNDANATAYPYATEIPNDGIDQDCNGSDLVTVCDSCHTQTEFTTTGHGKTSSTYASGNSAANAGTIFSDCTTYCHSAAVEHSTANNPYRLTTAGSVIDFSDAGSSTDNNVCLDCHASDGPNASKASVYLGTLSGSSNHYGAKHSAQTAGGNFCWDCHDPHGDANDYMIQDKVTKVSDGLYGKPSAAAGSTVAVTFPETSGTYDWNAYVNPTPDFNGLCQACHTATTRFKGGASGDNDTGHNAGSRCTTCHTHSSGFSATGGGSGCTGCHTQAEFTTTGHGKTSGTYASGNSAGNAASIFIDCTTYCHSGSVAHNTATNPYRLITAGSVVNFSDAGSTADNVVCLDCHATDGTNASKASKHLGSLSGANKHFGAKHSAQTEGGNFCWDCHDPHGDANDYMIQDSVTKVSDGVYGKASAAAGSTVAVTFPETSGVYDWAAYVNPTPFNGLCQACHTGTTRFNGGAGGDNDTGHNAGTRCTTCHAHSTGFPGVGGGGAGTDCKTCHGTGGSAVGSTNNRRNIETDFMLTYQHGYKWDNGSFAALDCELCHFLDNHTGNTVQLKVWTTTTAYTSIDYNAGNLPSMNGVCTSCHGDGTTGKGLVNSGTPSDINARWSNTGTTSYSKYADGGAGTFPNVVPQITKAYSPHANQGNNRSKDEATAANNNGTAVIACLECHPAHGSALGSGTNVTMGTGGIMLYDNSGVYTTEESLCWGCHPRGMDYYGDGRNAGDTADMDWSGDWNESLVVYKQGYDFLSSHFYPSKNGGVTWTNGVPSGTRSSVYCSTCHNPHGVASTDTDFAYRVPILRGTWLTSPYKEDRAPGSVSTAVYNSGSDTFGPLPRTVFAKYQSDTASGGGYSSSHTSGYGGFFIDKNTFGNNIFITETESKFGGLCLTCHLKTSLELADSGGRNWTGHSAVKWDNTTNVSYTDIFKSGDNSGTATFSPIPDSNTGGDLLAQDGESEWAMQWYGGAGDTLDTIYNSADPDRAWGTRAFPAPDDLTLPATPRTPTHDVKESRDYSSPQWSIDYTAQTTSGNIQEGYHQFPCSKCHTPHASRLPRLMRTNCLDNGSAAINTNESVTDYDNAYANQSGGVTGIHTPAGTIHDNIAGTANSSTNPGPNLMNFEAANCHSVGGSTSGGWNRITPWKEGIQPSNP